MKIYILTYSRKTFFSHKKRVSGIDVAAMTQYNILKEMGHDVRMFAAQTDLDQYFDGIDYFVNEMQPDIKGFARKNKNNIEKKIIQSIHEFQPDLILSNYEFSKFYEDLMSLNIPIAYVLHSMPGFWTDYNNANLLNKMTKAGHSFSCVSEYHKTGAEKYYRKGRDIWEFEEIIPDFVFYPQYCDKEEVQKSDGVIRHVSAASKGKDTFLINIFLEDSDYSVETFTTLGHQSKDQEDTYVSNSIKQYNKDIKIDIDHDIIMDQISKARLCFVGNYPDTFTITSLEALSRGVPLILKDKGGHPATEMVPPEFSKYLKLIKTKKQFLAAIEELKDITIEERTALSKAVEQQMGKDNYKKVIEQVITGTINKFNQADKTNLSQSDLSDW